MGKRYYCEYCDVFVANNTTAIKTHLSGLAHQRLRNEHYQRYKDADTIVEEEKSKKPCSRFARGECLFGGLCRFSHYTTQQIAQLQQIAAEKRAKERELPEKLFQELCEKVKKEEELNPGPVVYGDSSGENVVICPWNCSSELETCYESLPPSMKKINLQDFLNYSNPVEWG